MTNVIFYLLTAKKRTRDVDKKARPAFDPIHINKGCQRHPLAVQSLISIQQN